MMKVNIRRIKQRIYNFRLSLKKKLLNPKFRAEIGLILFLPLSAAVYFLINELLADQIYLSSPGMSVVQYLPYDPVEVLTSFLSALAAVSVGRLLVPGKRFFASMCVLTLIMAYWLPIVGFVFTVSELSEWRFEAIVVIVVSLFGCVAGMKLVQ